MRWDCFICDVEFEDDATAPKCPACGLSDDVREVRQPDQDDFEREPCDHHTQDLIDAERIP